MLKKCLAFLFILVCLVIFIGVKKTPNQHEERLNLFPIEHYSQRIDRYIDPKSPGYDKPLLTDAMRKQHAATFWRHYFGERSPWDKAYVKKLLAEKSPDGILSEEKLLLEQFTNNKDKTAKELIYGMNFRLHDRRWIKKISDNIDLTSPLVYQAYQRAITIDNALGRVLPTDDPAFFNPRLAGEGYPFDNLQASAVWVGTPLYIIRESKDHAWSLVLTPDFIVWIKSNCIARASEKFIDVWKGKDQNNLAAITQNHISITRKQHFLFFAYVGALFPLKSEQHGKLTIMVPVKNANQSAKIATVSLSPHIAQRMPQILTPHHFANLLTNMIGRPYGWGGKDFYNDCSSELKNLFTPFAIWLPRHSSQQGLAGLMIDMSKAKPNERLDFLIHHGRPFLTLVYLGHHIVLYVGNYPDKDDPNQKPMAMTYQNMWGLRPLSGTWRAVIGKSVFLPMRLRFKEDPHLLSQAALTYFQVSYLDQAPPKDAPLSQEEMPLRELMFPGLTALIKNHQKNKQPAQSKPD